MANGVPYCKPTDGKDSNKNQYDIRQIDTYGVGLYDETAFAVAHCDKAKLLLHPTKNGSKHQAKQRSCQADDVPFETEDGAYLRIGCSKASQRLDVLTFVNHEHRQGAYDIE